ncbi:MAG: hypothetical protein KF894_12110 [Labilithrix sp.]|nr:hypothetical protein [Labilithrix sp.]
MSACEPFRGFVEDCLARGRNAKAIDRDLVSQHGLATATTTRRPSESKSSKSDQRERTSASTAASNGGNQLGSKRFEAAK